MGLEDGLWSGRGELASSNALPVQKDRQIIEEPGLSVETLDEARDILSLKGGDQVGFFYKNDTAE